MNRYRIAMAAGDGIGPELLAATRSVLESMTGYGVEFEFSEVLFGAAAYRVCGDAIPPETVAGIQAADACLVGALAAGELPPPTPVGRMRMALGLFADVRPIRSIKGAWCLRDDIDLIFVRENMKGFLADRNMYKGSGEFMPDPDTVLSMRVLTRECCERIARYTFELAAAGNRKKVTLAHKRNVLRMSCGFFVDVCKEVAADYPGLVVDDMTVDDMANALITKPHTLDVILTTNLFGDILSDEGAALVSNIAPSANVGDNAAVFFPINHSARPELVGKDIASPLMHILCAAMMLRHLGERDAADALERSVWELLETGNALPGTTDSAGGMPASEATERIKTLLRKFRK